MVCSSSTALSFMTDHLRQRRPSGHSNSSVPKPLRAVQCTTTSPAGPAEAGAAVDVGVVAAVAAAVDVGVRVRTATARAPEPARPQRQARSRLATSASAPSSLTADQTSVSAVKASRSFRRQKR